MDDTNISLKLMTRSLQDHINLATTLNLGFTAQLLSMAVMEIKINMHDISQQEVDALCDHLEEKTSCGAKPPMVTTPILRSHERRARVRRSRA